MESRECQLHHWPAMAEGRAPSERQSLPIRLKIVLKRQLTPATKRRLKKHYDRLAKRVSRLSGHDGSAQSPAPPPARLDLQPGEAVRVRAKQDILATLDSWKELRGCGFMEEMEPFCETQQRVLKPVRQFLDERDYRLKKTSGIVLLDGVMCEGMRLYGPCDRACLFFWREEWLERVE